jgi:prepilin-type processing-associated H-X9-DG protein
LLNIYQGDKMTRIRKQCGLGNGVILTELLAAAVITVILTAMLLPVILKASDKLSPKQVCQNNLKALYQAFEMYRADNNGYYPPSFSDSGCWPLLIKQYVEGENLENKGVNPNGHFYCPSVPESKKDTGVSGFYVSYGYNVMALGGGSKKWTSEARHHKRGPIRLIRKVPHPSMTLLLVDADAPGQPYDGWYQAYPGLVSARHEGMANVLFCDGHVESLTEEQLLQTSASDTNHAPWFGHLSTQSETPNLF